MRFAPPAVFSVVSCRQPALSQPSAESIRVTSSALGDTEIFNCVGLDVIGFNLETDVPVDVGVSAEFEFWPEDGALVTLSATAIHTHRSSVRHTEPRYLSSWEFIGGTDIDPSIDRLVASVLLTIRP